MVVEVHPPNVENRAKIWVKLLIIPPNAQQRFAPLVTANGLEEKF